MKRYLLIMAIAMMPSACTRQEKLAKNLIVPVDLSASRDTTVTSWYRSVICNSIIGNAGQKDCITVLPLDEGSATASEELLAADFSRNNYVNEFAGPQADEAAANWHLDSVKSAVKRFQSQYDRALAARKSLSQSTDVFGAIQTARKYFLPGRENVIILLSDMLQCTKGGLNFERNLNDTSEIRRCLDIAPQYDLSSFEVVVLNGAQTKMSPEKFAVVRQFWERYFALCHAHMADYSSGAVAKLERLLQQ